MKQLKYLLACLLILLPCICRSQDLSDKEREYYKMIKNRETLDSLSNQKNLASQRLSVLLDSLNVLEAEISRLEEICRTHPFAEDYHTDSMMSVITQELQKLLSLPLSGLRHADITRNLKRCEDLSEKADVADYKRKYEMLRQYKEMYDRAEYLMNNPYNEVSLTRFEKDLKTLREAGTEDKYLNELNDIADKLYYYPDAVYYFCEIIKEVESLPTDTDYRSLLSQVWTDNKSYIDYFIDEIPYLKNRFDKYQEDLLSSPVRKSEVADEIKKML